MATTKAYRVGDATVIKIPELALEASDPGFFYPGQINVSSAVEETRKFWPGSVDPQTGMLRMSIHSWLVRTPTRVILVDTGAGNDKDRPNVPSMNHLNGPFLDRLKAAEVRPEQVDLVLLTHLHVDHVGWNTKKVNGRWVPTFPNARYVYSRRERAYLAALSAKNGSDAAIQAEAKLGPVPHPPLLGIYDGVYEDSILPVIDAGLAQELEAELDFFENNWPRDLPSGVIHADLFNDNVLFLHDKLSGLIDFYFACNDSFAYDVAICLNAWCFEADKSFNATKARALLQGYGKVRALDDRERGVLPLLARGAALRFLLTRLYDWVHTPADALVKRKDPQEYLAKLRFHRATASIAYYGL